MTDSMTAAKLGSRLRGVHQRVRTLNMLTGALTLLAWAGAIFLVVFAFDWLIRLPMLIRLLLLLGLLGVSIHKAWRGGWSRLRSFDAARTALRVEEHYKNLKSLLVAGVQLNAQDDVAGTSRSMSAFTIRNADAAAADLKVVDVVPFDIARKPAALVGVLCALFCALAVINGPVLTAGLTRVFAPWIAAAYPTRTQIMLEDEQIVVKEGGAVRVQAMLSGEIPKRAKLALKTGKGKPRKRDLDVKDASCVYELAAAFRSFDYAIKAGDADTGWRTVTVISSPRVARSRVRLVYPEYMQRPPETLEAMTLTVPEGAQIEWELALDQAVSRATFALEGESANDLEVSDDGLTVRHQMQASASGAYAFTWVEKAHGFEFTTSKHYMQVAPDQAPQVELTSPSKNLFATLGRNLVLAYRARDDHGIGEARILFRRNDATEQSVAFSSSTTPGRSVETIDWDYRDALDDLAIGDVVTFAIELSDSYPGVDGPHRVRSESRRVSFLSTEDYLEKIMEQQARLLSQLRAVYRQERAAYEVIKALDPNADSFEQTCFLESSRQDILAERLTLLSDGIDALMQDLEANGIEDKAQVEGLIALRDSLRTLCATQILEAASRLRDLGPAPEPQPADVAATSGLVNDAAKRLGSLVLQLGVNEAMEVFATELHVIAEAQSRLRVQALEARGAQAALAKTQAELAEWIDRLLGELSRDPDYSKAPLTIVRLARMVKDLRKAGIDVAMRSAGDDLAEGALNAAADAQAAIIAELFELERHIRVGAEYEALLNARDRFSASLATLGEMVEAGDAIGNDDVQGRLAALHRELRLLIMPAIPAPQNSLLSATPSEEPPVEALVASTLSTLDGAMRDAQSGARAAASSKQDAAAATLRSLSDIVATRIAEVSKTSRYAGNSGASMDRASLVRELLARQMRLTEKTEDADYDELSGAYLAPSQLHLSKEVLRMRTRLERKSARSGGDSKLVLPMLKLLSEASDAMLKAGPALAEEKLGEAIDHQDDALDALQGAMGFANHEATGWLGLANLLITTEGVALPARYMRDVVAEQKDLIAATASSTPESRAQLLLVQTNLMRAVLEVSLLLEGTGSALDFEQAMLFAGSDMGLSAQKLAAGDVAGAMRAQRMAVDSVGDLSAQFQASETQFYYFVTALEFLQGMHTEGVVLRNRIAELSDALEASAEGQGEALASVIADAAHFSAQMLQATGRKDYGNGHAALAPAAAALKANDAYGCIDALTASGEALAESLTELRELSAKIAYVPEVLPIEAPPEYEVMMDMVMVAVQQRTLGEKLFRADDAALPDLALELQDLQAEIVDLVEATAQHSAIVMAQTAMTEAAAHLAKAEGEAAYQSLFEARSGLRHAVLEYALYYIEIQRSGGSKRKKKGKSGIVSMFKMSNKLKAAYDKDWGGVEGEDPKAGRSEWEVLGRRDRAALNENFVRELPLEYREFLKDYYERLAR